jgi:hypothetical protein
MALTSNFGGVGAVTESRETMASIYTFPDQFSKGDKSTKYSSIDGRLKNGPDRSKANNSTLVVSRNFPDEMMTHNRFKGVLEKTLRKAKEQRIPHRKSVEPKSEYVSYVARSDNK